MKIFLSVSAALIAVPTLAIVGFSALYVGSAGRIDQRERQCVFNTGLSRTECTRQVSAEIHQELIQSTNDLKRASGELSDSWQTLTR